MSDFSTIASFYTDASGEIDLVFYRLFAVMRNGG